MNNPSKSKPYEVRFKPSAGREWDRLPSEVKSRIQPAFGNLARNPRPSGVKKLQGRRDIYRIRVGDYRVVYEINDEERIVRIARIGHRSEVYE